jgi:hypothetical protein
MTWVTAALVSAYIGVCEVRAPNAWTACESRWNWALGVLVPSPLPAMARLLPGRRRRQDEPEQP